VAPTVISLNYDVLVDNGMFALGLYENRGFPDYGAQATNSRLPRERFARLLKLHGSLNWMHCPACDHLELLVTESMHTSKALYELYNDKEEDLFLVSRRKCSTEGCSGIYAPLLLAPSFRKNYGNVHLDAVWTQAREALQAADRVVIIGYSLPTDDVEVGLLLKTGLANIDPSKVTVVEYTGGRPELRKLEDNPVGRRFRSLLGQGIDWQPDGFENWLNQPTEWTER
jgi:NAD-dependent SIR2 family protein deacetylase